MTNADPADIVTAGRDGVTVEKSFESNDFPVPAIAFRIESDRDTTVSIRLVEPIPEDVAPENIGFHPMYGAEFWDVEEGQIVFERDLSPDEEYTTVYGLRDGEADVPDKFMREPILESVEAVDSEADGDIDAALDAAAMDDVLPSDDSRDSEAEPLESESTDASANGNREEPEVLEIGDKTGEIGADTGSVDPDRSLGVDEEADSQEASGQAGQDVTLPEQADTDLQDSPSAKHQADSPGETADTAQSDAAVEAESEATDSIISELASELRAGSVDQDDIMELRDVLGLDLGTASVEARIEHIQNQVSDLDAYRDSFESFLDEEGDAQSLIAEARDGYEETTARLEEIETELEAIRSGVDEQMAAIDETIEERFESEVQEVRSELDDRLDAVDETIEDQVDTELESIRSEIEDRFDSIDETIEDRVESELETLTTEIEERFTSIEETIEEQVDSEIEAIRSETDSLERRLETQNDAREQIESEIAELSAELEAVAEMRDRLTNALGGIGGGTSPGVGESSEQSAANENAGGANEEEAAANTAVEDSGESESGHSGENDSSDEAIDDLDDS